MHDIDEIRRRAMLLLEKEVGGPVAAAAIERAFSRQKYLRFAIDMVFAYR